MDEEIEIGQIIRYLMEDHKKSLRTTRRSILNEFKIDKHKYNNIIHKVSDKLKEIGIFLVGIDGIKPINFMKAERYFLIEDTHLENKRLKTNIEDKEFNLMVCVFTIIFVEGEHVCIERLVKLLEKIEILVDTDILGYLNTLKRKGYLDINKINEEIFVKYNWRFYIEFPEFDPIKIINKIEREGEGKKENNDNIKDNYKK